MVLKGFRLCLNSLVDGNGSLLYDILSLMESELNITPATIKLDETATKQLDKPVSSVNKQSNIEVGLFRHQSHKSAGKHLCLALSFLRFQDCDCN